MDKIMITGNLGKDPEMRFTPSGQPVTSFAVAVNKRYTPTGGGPEVKSTTWYRVQVWDKKAEACNTYLKKGSKVLVEGSLVADLTTGGPKIFTRQDGSAGANFEVRASSVEFLSGLNAEGSRPGEDDNDEDIF